MSEKYNYIKSKTTYGLFFSGLFLVASTLTPYAVNSSDDQSNTAGLDPTIKVVNSNSLVDMTLNFTEADITAAQAISTLAADVTGDEFYMAIASYQVCILSNTFDPDSNDFAGILMKVSTVDDDDYHKDAVTGANPSTATQLALYNDSTGKKIPYLLEVTPAGYTKSDKTFGAGSAVGSGTYLGQYEPVPFIIGGDSANLASPTIYLQDADADELASASTPVNLSLDVFGSVNHYGVNSHLDADDVVGSTASTLGLSTTENFILTGCTGDQVPGDGASSTSMLLTIVLYANAAEMAVSPAGDYRAEFTLNYGNINDQAGSAVYDTSAVGTDD